VMSDLEQELREAIETLADPEAQPRLLKVLPSLLEGVASWGGPTSPKHKQDEVFIAAAMPGSCIVFAADGWPAYDEEQAAKLNRGDLALAVCGSLTRPPSHEVNTNILIALTVLMGPEALERHQREVRSIRSGGGVPLVAALFDPEGDNVAILVTTVAMLRPTLH
jgi:hypothetical protein